MSKKYLFITGGNGEIGKSIISQFQDYIVYAPSSKEMDCSDVNSIRNYILHNGINQIDVFDDYLAFYGRTNDISLTSFNIWEPFIALTSISMNMYYWAKALDQIVSNGNAGL